MRKMVAWVLALVLSLGMVTTALGERPYLIADSDTRLLTEAELWEWDYESLGYIFNEILARHGYAFIPGQKYDYYFRCMPWYTPNENDSENKLAYAQVTSVEWQNIHLAKVVREQMKAQGTTNPGGKSVWDQFSTGFDALQGFTFVKMPANQTLPVYSAPSSASWRGANGKAAVSTNGTVMAAGWESGWLLVMYETNNGSVRVGYVSSGDIRGNVPLNTLLSFDYSTATVNASCQLTDDPARRYASIATLQAGAQVTYLSTFFNNSAWAYIETQVNGQTVRGFIPASALDLAEARYETDK